MKGIDKPYVVHLDSNIYTLYTYTIYLMIVVCFQSCLLTIEHLNLFFFADSSPSLFLLYSIYVYITFTYSYKSVWYIFPIIREMIVDAIVLNL